MIAAALDRLISRYGSGPCEPEVIRAREEYFERTGRVFEDDEIYEARTLAFLEWYALERLQGSPPRSPAELFLRECPDEAPTLQAVVRALCTSHRSLFELSEIAEPLLLLEDLAAGGRHRVTERRRLPGVGVGDVFEARLVAFDGEILFLRSFLFHPRSAVSAIRQLASESRRRREAPADLCDRLSQLRVRCERYRHVPAARIYDGSADTGVLAARAR